MAEEEQRVAENWQLAEAAELLLHQQALVGKEAIAANDRKKHRNKFVPMADAKVPLELIALPAKHALKWMETSGYVKLYYFTNKGIAEAKQVATTPSDESLMWKQ